MPELTIPATAILADAPILMSILKPVLVIATFVAYMRFVAKFEGDARMFTLPVAAWNFAYIGVAIVALLTTLFIPIFWIGWILALGMLAGTMFGYWKFRDKRVPERVRFKFKDFTDVRTGKLYSYDADVLQLYVTATF